VEPWKTWVRNVFVPALQSRVDRDLPGSETVYADDQLQGGATWQTALSLAVCASRIMVPVFISRYFESDACRRELAHMRQREDVCGFRTATEPNGLIVPVRLSERRFFPDETNRIQDHNFTPFAIPTLRPNTETYDRFEVAMDALFSDIVASILRAKNHDPAWRMLDGHQYMSLLLPKPLVQPIPPAMAA
jgi:hypothetical protein